LSEAKTHSVVLDPQTRIDVRMGVEDEGEVKWFVVQLLHNLEPYHADDDDWREVARFDHNPEAMDGHDVVEEGLHMDLIFENGENDVKDRFPEHRPPPDALGNTVRYCGKYLSGKHEQLIEEYNDDRRTAR
jgi:hypothetical protein